MSFTTPNDLFALALKNTGVIGIGQTALAEDINDTFNLCNMMLAQWQRKRWLIWHLVDTTKVSTGAQRYTIGLGGDFNIVRPDKLEGAFIRQVSISPLAPDYPLHIISARQDYNRIALKSLTAFPQYVFYDSAFPLGTVFVWPIPQASLYEIHLTTKEQLSQFATLQQTINLPAEYFAAIFYNLCVRLRPAYQMQPDPTLIALAKDSLNVIRNANAQIPRLKMPDNLVARGVYDVYSDRIN
jgi:hypothetical protein